MLSFGLSLLLLRWENVFYRGCSYRSDQSNTDCCITFAYRRYTHSCNPIRPTLAKKGMASWTKEMVEHVQGDMPSSIPTRCELIIIVTTSLIYSLRAVRMVLFEFSLTPCEIFLSCDWHWWLLFFDTFKKRPNGKDHSLLSNSYLRKIWR